MRFEVRSFAIFGNTVLSRRVKPYLTPLDDYSKRPVTSNLALVQIFHITLHFSMYLTINNNGI